MAGFGASENSRRTEVLKEHALARGCSGRFGPLPPMVGDLPATECLLSPVVSQDRPERLPPGGLFNASRRWRAEGSDALGPFEPSTEAGLARWRGKVLPSIVLTSVCMAGCTPPTGDTETSGSRATQARERMSKDKQAGRAAALAQLDQAVRAKGAPVAERDAPVLHPGFSPGESYTNPDVGQEVTLEYPLISDRSLPGRYTVVPTLVEQKLQFALRTLSGELVAAIYVFMNDGKALPDNEIKLRIYDISERSGLTREGALLRSRLTLRRFASTIVALSKIRRSPSMNIRVAYESKEPGELL